MKRYTIIFAILLTLVLPVYANDTLQREVTIVRDFTPTIRDAEKINTLPPISTPTFSRSSVSYAFDALATEITTKPSYVAPYTSATKSEIVRYNGYANIDFGMNLAIAANAGYRILDTKSDQLGIAAQFTSINGNMPVNSNALLIPESNTQQTFYDFRSGLHYAHIFNNNITAKLNGSYRYIDFNYYGVMGNAAQLGNHPFQHVHNFYAEASVDNHEARNYDYELWNVTAGYKQYSNSNGVYTQQASNEHYAYIDASYSRMLTDHWYAGADVELDYLHYNGLLPSTSIDNTTPNTANVFMARLLPHALWSKDRMSLRAGVKIDISAGDNTIFRFAPDIRYNWEFIENYFLFATIDGGKQLHTWNDMSQHCLYFNPSQRIPSTYTPFDGQLGVRLHIIPELTVTLYGGYEVANGALFQQIDASSQAIEWAALDANCIKAGLDINANITQYVTITADAAYRQWSDQNQQSITYNRPRWEANIGITVRPLQQLNIKLDYNMQLERDFGSYGKLADIHNLQLFAQYRVLDWMSISLHGNNLLNHKYDYYFGLPAPGIQVMGGIAVNF